MDENYPFIYANDTRLLSEQLLGTGSMLASFIQVIQLIVTNFFWRFF